MDKLRPKKILGKGSQGTVILTNNDNYTVKIYTKAGKNLKMLIKIINFFIKSKIPKTIYKSYYLTEKKDSLDRYINKLPNNFSYNSNNLEKYEIKIRLYEIMKTYDITLKDFINKLLKDNIDEDIKIEIIHSLLYQGIVTLLWLYIKKGIIHLDINSDNFFVEKTDDKDLSIKIKDKTYNVKLYGYYLIIADFGYGRSIELIDSDEYKYSKSMNLEELNIHPWRDTNDLIKIFKKYYKELGIKNIGIKNNIANSRFNSTRLEYKNMIRSYYNKKEYLKFMNKYVLINPNI